MEMVDCENVLSWPILINQDFDKTVYLILAGQTGCSQNAKVWL